VARVVLRLTLRNVGTPQVEGRVFGESIFLVNKFFGRTDLNGTFEGPFNGSLEEVRFGAAKTNRHGTGDFAGRGLHGVAVQNPPGSGTEVENGRGVGGDEPWPADRPPRLRRVMLPGGDRPSRRRAFGAG